METINQNTFSEVLLVLNHTEKEIIEKIPEKFKIFLLKNSNKYYTPNIDFTDNNWENTLSEDAKALLAMIYRDYVVSLDEKKELLEEERKEREKKEELLREKNNPDNLFKNNIKNDDENNSIDSTQLEIIEESPWYKNIFKKILSFFKPKK